MLAFLRRMGYNKDEPREKRRSAGEPEAVSSVLNDHKEASPMNQDEFEPQDERDIVEFSDEEGNKLLLEVMDYFFYNGEEYAVLCDADEEAGQDADLDDEEDQMIYIMRVVSTTNEDGEEMEEFIPPEDSLLDQLIEVVQTRFTENDDDPEDDEPEDK